MEIKERKVRKKKKNTNYEAIISYKWELFGDLKESIFSVLSRELTMLSCPPSKLSSPVAFLSALLHVQHFRLFPIPSNRCTSFQTSHICLDSRSLRFFWQCALFKGLLSLVFPPVHNIPIPSLQLQTLRENPTSDSLLPVVENSFFPKQSSFPHVQVLPRRRRSSPIFSSVPLETLV